MEQAISTGGESNPLDSTGLCLLSLDGGGVRGLSTLYILKNIMDRLNHKRSETANLPPVKPCEVFDLIGGTSTGGLIAIMLGRLEMDVDECITAYSELAEAVFGEKLSSFPFNVKGKVKARFDSAKLEQAVRKVVQRSASKTDLLNDGAERGCRTFVCTADRDTKDIVRLRSYSLPDEPNIRATICQAALATSAATTFFEPVSIGDRTFADGGLGANNPVDEVEGEASNIWCSETGDLKPLVKCFVSIGTGNPGKRAFEDNMIKFLGQTMVNIAIETENTEKKFIARWAKHFDEKRYYRFNVDQGLQNIGLHEYKKNGAMHAATEGYLTHMAQKFRVRDCIHNLRLKQNRTDTSFDALVKEYTVRRFQQHPARHEASWVVPFERNDRFTGRESQLTQLEEKVFVKDRTAKTAITGLGGVGKTQLVLELVYRIRATYRNCSVIWIPATNLESFQQAYLDVAQQLGIPGWEEDKADVKRLVQGFLSKESAGQWLLVFDNADDIDMWIPRPGSKQESDHLIEYLPRSKQGSIIFTTRDRKTAVKLAYQNIVDVPEMNENMATKLLQKYLVNYDLVNNEQDAKTLLTQLTYLPLAIVQAAAYINENGIALADYISLLDDQEEEVIDLLSEEFEDDARYRNTKNPVATTWLISFEQVQHRDPLAAEFLSFMACVDPKDIPQSLLPPGPSRKKETDAIGTLHAYSFISRRSADLALDTHRLVHLATRGWLRKEGLLTQWNERAITRLKNVFPDIDHQNRSVWRRYLSHARYALESNIIDKCGENRIDLAWKFGMCHYRDGRFNEAEVLFTEVMETYKRLLSEEHPSLLAVMGAIASTYRNQGRWKQAEELGVKVLEVEKRILGEEHPDTLTSINNLALTFWSQGRWEETEELHIKALDISKRVLGIEHPDTLISMANLALTYQSQGRWDKAETLGIQVMETLRRVNGAEHPSTLSSMVNLALTYSDQGRWKEVEELETQVVEVEKRVLGEEHPDTLNSMNNLAVTFWNQGRWKKAEELEVRVIETQKKILGIEHPSIQASSINLASIYRDQGRLKEAEELGLQVIEVQKRVFGKEHPDTLTGMVNLASTYSKQGRWKEAEELGVKVVKTRKRVLGEEHPDTLTSMANLASTYSNQGRWKEAEELEVQTTKTQKSLLGQEHPETLTGMSNLALTLWNQGRLKEAEELEVQVMETRKAVLGAEHPDTLTSMANLAFTWKGQGKAKKAIALMEECFRYKMSCIGIDHPDTQSSLEALNQWREEDTG